MAEAEMNVYECISAVSGELAKEGIAKTRTNATQNYKFRGIDEVYNALAPMLSRHGLVILPRILSRDVVERQSKNGGVLFTVTVEAEFDFVSAKDGSKHTVRTYGEAMDSADKATNKAMSAAYKYAAMQTFCIPTEGDNDADAVTPEVAPQQGYAMDAPLDHAPRHAVSAVPAAPVGPSLVDGQVYVRRVESKPTRKPNVTRYDIMLSTGESVATIKGQLAGLAEEACRENRPVTIKTKASQYGTDLIDLKFADKRVMSEDDVPEWVREPQVF